MASYETGSTGNDNVPHILCLFLPVKKGGPTVLLNLLSFMRDQRVPRPIHRFFIYAASQQSFSFLTL